MTHKLFTTIFMVLFVCQSFAGVTLNPASSNKTIQLEYDQGGYTISKVNTGGGEFTTISAEGCEGITLKKGAPELPFTATAIAIAKGATPIVSISNTIYEEVVVTNLIPSLGSITRDVDIATVKRIKGADYSKDAWYPAENAVLGNPYVTQGVSGVALRLFPFQYNPVKGILRVLKSADIEVKTQTEGFSPRVLNSVSRRVHLKERFINGELVLNISRYTPVEASDRMIIITPAKFETALAPLVEWKNKKGIKTTVHIYGDEVSSGDAGVTAFIKKMYNDEDAGYFLLVGDWEDIPSIMTTFTGSKTETVSSDPRYVFLEGNDMYPDAFIGRISPKSATDVTNYVNKILKYEMEPQKGGDWYSKTVSLGSNESDNGPTDYEFMQDSINPVLEDHGYTTIDEIYQGIKGSTADFSNYLNDGRGLVNYMGHGSNTGIMFTSGFGFYSQHAEALINGDMLHVVIPLACNIGQFKGRTCVSEVWMNNPNGGALVIMGSSPLMDWSQPQASQVEQNRLLAKSRHISVGATFYNGQMKMLDTYGSGGNKTVQSWNYFGDPSVMMFSQSPKDMTVSHDESFTTGSNTLSVTAVDGAIVCVYSDEGGILGTAEVQNGSASVAFTAGAETELHLTVTALNHMPYFGKLTSGSADPFVTVTAPNGGEKLSLGEAYLIKWNDNVDEKATITLIKGNEKVKEIATEIDGKSYTWDVKDIAVDDGYKIVVKCGSHADTSDASFLIKESAWSKNLVAATMWGNGADEYSGINKSTVTMTHTTREAMVSAAFTIGTMDEAAKIYPWANISAYLGSDLDGVTAVKVLYKADKKINLTLDQSVLMDAGTSYYTELPATGDSFSEIVISIDEFKQPDWVEVKSDLNLAEVKAISFSPVGYEIDAALEIKDARLADYNGEYVGVLNSGLEMQQSSPVTLLGVKGGTLALNIGQQGNYTISVVTVNGRVLMDRSIAMNVGMNSIALTDAFSSQVLLLSIEGMGHQFKQKLFVK